MPRSISLPSLLLRLEGLAVFAAAIALFIRWEGSWLLFALLILAPDLSELGYLAGPRVGSITYNVVHTYALPGALAAVSFYFVSGPLL